MNLLNINDHLGLYLSVSVHVNSLAFK